MGLMKNTLLLLILIATTVVSCSNDDDTTQQDRLTGSWDLRYIYGGIGGIADTIPSGTVTYTFNNGALLVENNNPEPDYSFLQSGSYNYNFTTISNIEYLQINNKPYEIFSIETSAFSIGDDVPLDGLGYTFER